MKTSLLVFWMPCNTMLTDVMLRRSYDCGVMVSTQIIRPTSPTFFVIDLRTSSEQSGHPLDAYPLPSEHGLNGTEQYPQPPCLADTSRAARLQVCLQWPRLHMMTLKTPRKLKRTTVSFELTSGRTAHGDRRAEIKGSKTSMKSSMSLRVTLATLVRKRGSLIRM